MGEALRPEHASETVRLPQAADLFDDILPQPTDNWRGLVPGLFLTTLATLAAAYLSSRYGAPLTLMALMVGLSLNFLNSDRRLAPGLVFASRTLLRIGIVLVGSRVTFGQVAGLGLEALACIIAIVALTIGSAVLVADWLRLPRAFGVLAAGSVAICGASAALAFATLLGERRISQPQLAMVLVGISAMSSLAMLLYPAFAHMVGFGDVQAGFLIGAATHDVAQAIGAGYSYSQHAGETATIVKLVRVALLAPALAIVGLAMVQKPHAVSAPLIPWFVVGFFGLAAANSSGVVPIMIAGWCQNLAAALLAGAVAATGIRSPLQSLLGIGVKPWVLIGTSSLIAFAASAAVALFIFR